MSEGHLAPPALWEWDGDVPAGAAFVVAGGDPTGERKIDWADVRRRSAALADRHEMEPPLSVSEFAELEEWLGFGLPGDYRSFLLEVGRGGAGPGFGLFPVRRVDGGWSWDSDGGPSHDLESLRRPFAHIRGFNPSDGLPERPECGRDEELWWEACDRIVYDPAHSHGLLYLCHLGCALWAVLVVSGPSRGEIWTDFTADGEGFQPEQNPDGSRMSFTDWYLAWLAEAEREAAGT